MAMDITIIVYVERRVFILIWRALALLQLVEFHCCALNQIKCSLRHVNLHCLHAKLARQCSERIKFAP
jgi:hypothetical protein